MTDETYRHTLLFVEPGLEGKQRQHQVTTFANLQHTFLTPGPDRWTDVMHGLDPGLAQVQLDIEGEVRRIDTDEHIRAFFDQGLDQSLAPLE
ncbi:hypothetical protein D9M73_237290 [compost metagenome]